MAIDNENKRRNVADVYPVPDGDISSYDDRRHITLLYRGVGPEVSELPVGVLTLTAFALDARVTESTALPAGTLILSPNAPINLLTESTAIPAGALVLTGNATVQLLTESVSLPSGSVVLSGNAFVALLTESVSVPAGSLSLTAFALDARLTESSALPTGALTLSPNALVALLSESTALPAGALSLNAQTPTIEVTEDTGDSHTSNLGAGALTLDPLAPTILHTVTEEIPRFGGGSTPYFTKQPERQVTICRLPAKKLKLFGFEPQIQVSEHASVLLPSNVLVLELSPAHALVTESTAIPSGFFLVDSPPPNSELTNYPTPEELISLLAMSE